MRKQYGFSKGKRGAVIASPAKTRVAMMLDDDIIEHFRADAEAKGADYQTMINAALRALLARSQRRAKDDEPVTVDVLRKGFA